MELKIYQSDGISINYSKSSIEIFPALKQLGNSEGLYLKFSRNRIRFTDMMNHKELLLDFDLCLIDTVMNETVIQLFAIFTLTKNDEPLKDVSYISFSLDFARSLIIDTVSKDQLTDKNGAVLIVPALSIDPALIDHFD